jgi:hypothetical protein
MIASGGCEIASLTDDVVIFCLGGNERGQKSRVEHVRRGSPSCSTQMETTEAGISGSTAGRRFLHLGSEKLSYTDLHVLGDVFIA